MAHMPVTPEPLAEIAVDATSGKLVPVDNEEWTCVLTAAGISSGAPTHLYTCQGSSPLTSSRDEIGIHDLTQNGASMLYDQTVSGWTRKAMTLPDGAVSNGWLTTSILNLATTSCLLLLYVDITGAAAATREIAGLGSGADHRYVAVTSGARIRASDLAGVNATTGSAPIPAGVFPIVLKVDRANTVFKVYSSEEIIAVTWGAPSGGGNVFVIGDALAGGAAPCAYLYAALFEGSAAEITDASVRSLLQTLGWTVAW